MYGVSKITSEQDIMMITFTDADATTALPAALSAFADSGITVDMICQSAPRSTKIDFSFTTHSKFFDAAMRTIAAYKMQSGANAPLVSSGYSKVNLFGKEMVISCGVAARALKVLLEAKIEVALITTSDLDISLLVRAEDEDSAVFLLEKAFSC